MERRRLKKSEREAVYSKTGGRCAYCGTEIALSDMQVDHLIPISRGGADEPSNMLPACRSCNHYKHSADLEVFRSMLENMPNVLMRDSVTYRNALRYGLVVPRRQPVLFYFERVGIVSEVKKTSE